MGIVFVEHHHGVDARERSQHLGAFVLGINRPRRPFKGAYRTIGVDRDDEHIAFAPRILQIADMPRVQQIEHPVGKDHFLAGVAQMLDEGDGVCGRQNLSSHALVVLPSA